MEEVMGGELPFLVSMSPHVAFKDFRGSLYHPQHVEDLPFLTQLFDFYRQHAFGLASDLPKWAWYDCVLRPGIVLGLASNAQDGSFPTISAMMAISALPHALGLRLHALAWNGDGEALKAALALLLAWREERSFQVVLPWNHPALPFLLEDGPILLKTAFAPAHDESQSLVGFWQPQSQSRFHLLEKHEAKAETLEALHDRLEGNVGLYLLNVEKGTFTTGVPHGA